MREILFRGKRKDNGEWVYGFVIKRKRDGVIKTYIYNDYYDETEIDEYCNEADCLEPIKLKDLFIEVIPETVGQFTGLRDRDECKIFEGDIAKQQPILCDEEKIGVVSIKPTQGVCIGAYPFSAYPCKILGNKWDNPELLQEDTKCQ